MNTNQKLLIGGGAAVFVAVAAFLLWPSSDHADDNAIELKTDDGQTVRLALAQPDDDIRKAMTSPADGYFALPESEREAYLDKIIDEQAKLMDKFDLDPGSLRSGTGGQIRIKGGTPDAPDASSEKTFTFKGGFDPMGDLPAEDQARMAEFTKALADRRKARGIEGPMVIMRTITK